VCSKPSIAEIQKIIYEKFSPQSNVVNFVSILKKTLASASPILTNIQAPTPTSATDSRSDISYNEQLLGSVKEYEVLFLDMYDGFEPDNNFFMDLFKANRFNVSVFQSNQDSKNLPDFIIHGSFNRRNENDFYPETIPRIFFSGECEQRYPINHQDRRIQLFLTFNLREDERYMRLPIWVLYLDWFNKIPVTTTTSTKSVDQYPRNPGIMPLTLATDSNPNPYISRKEFCSFIVSNPHCNTRNLFFKKLSTAYKKVNSAGKFLNNIGEPIGCLHEGGGQGDAAKHNYLTKHKFNICFENTCESGYITEKVLQAKLAGCVPLYWGEQNIAIDFDQQGIVNLSGKSLAEMIQTVKYLDEHPEEASKIARIPALSDELLCYWQNRLTKIASRIRTIVETSKSQEHLVQSQALAPVPALASPPKSLVFLTYLHESTKSSNINSLIFSVKYLEQIIPKNQDFQYAVYYHPDISQSILDLLISYSSKSQINIQLHKLNIHSTNPFPQYWNYNIYGWRCELLKQASINPSFKDKTVVFQTYECIWTHIPEFLSTILNQLENPIMFLRNTTVKNNTIAPANIRKHLQITAEELNSNIIDPDIIIFKAGSEWVQNFLNLASTYIHNEDVLLNNPDISLLNNEIITHKYDCIVWSVLVKRYVLPNIVLDDFVDLLSLRSTYKMAKPVYLHKGKFVDIHRIYPNIDCINIINLDRRKDRLNQFYENNPGLLGFVERVRAVDGKELKLDRQMVKLFRKNNFAWKKSVMGCALSHYNIWKQLVNEKSAKINNYLILEDDVRFINTYQQDMVNSLKNLPDDWDILYLGGVLPINRENYPHVLEKVTGNWFRIMPNPCFSGGGENIPIYHHCTYSYIINRKSAQKLIDIVDEHGIYTSLDHLLMGLSLNNGKIFVHYPSVTYSFQDEDEDYKTTEFDNFNRIVKYDSDIWNNTDSFTEKDIQDCLAGTSTPAPVQAPESVLNP
jgi:GR25 family glycosyltransferase involved in LPS biosynthesis